MNDMLNDIKNNKAYKKQIKIMYKTDPGAMPHDTVLNGMSRGSDIYYPKIPINPKLFNKIKSSASKKNITKYKLLSEIIKYYFKNNE